mmetsp:Transcript_34886/g.53547  ORF Transcript_34886/g.53547 Transcript_34886/m.53547 type:complete len:268 (+) Transcript_34886:269-1072(+)
MKKGAAAGANDFFEAMFGAGNPKFGPKKTRSVVHPIKCTLEDLYKGKATRIRVVRDRLKVVGGDEGAKTLVKEPKVLECRIEKGAPDGEKYIFHGEADEHPEKEAGDVVFVVSQQPHSTYKRNGADLLLTKEISLIEALCGVDFEVGHLDGTKFRIKSQEGKPIKPNEILTIQEKGMPFHKSGWKFGNLFVMFKVQFPEQVTPEQKDAIHKSLIGVDKQKSAIPNERIREVKYMEPFEDEQRNTHAQGGTKAQDSDDEDHHDEKERV